MLTGNPNGTQLEAKVAESIGQEPSYGLHSALSQSVKVFKDQGLHSLEDPSQSRQIEQELKKLANKYSVSTQ